MELPVNIPHCMLTSVCEVKVLSSQGHFVTPLVVTLFLVVTRAHIYYNFSELPNTAMKLVGKLSYVELNLRSRSYRGSRSHLYYTHLSVELPYTTSLLLNLQGTFTITLSSI